MNKSNPFTKAVTARLRPALGKLARTLMFASVRRRGSCRHMPKEDD